MTVQISTRGVLHVPLELVTVYGIAFLIAMAAIAVGLTWIGLQAEPPGTGGGPDAEAAD